MQIRIFIGLFLSVFSFVLNAEVIQVHCITLFHKSKYTYRKYSYPLNDIKLEGENFSSSILAYQMEINKNIMNKNKGLEDIKAKEVFVLGSHERSLEFEKEVKDIAGLKDVSIEEARNLLVYAENFTKIERIINKCKDLIGNDRLVDIRISKSSVLAQPTYPLVLKWNESFQRISPKNPNFYETRISNLGNDIINSLGPWGFDYDKKARQLGIDYNNDGQVLTKTLGRFKEAIKRNQLENLSKYSVNSDWQNQWREGLELKQQKIALDLFNKGSSVGNNSNYRVLIVDDNKQKVYHIIERFCIDEREKSDEKSLLIKKIVRKFFIIPKEKNEVDW